MAYYLVMSQTSGGCLHFEIITIDKEQAEAFVNKKQTEAPDAQYMIQEFPERDTPIPTPHIFPSASTAS